MAITTMATIAPGSAPGYAAAHPSRSTPGIVIIAAAIGTMLTSWRRTKMYAATNRSPMPMADTIHGPRSAGDPAVPRTPPITARRTLASARRRVQPAVTRFAIDTTSSRATILVKSVTIGLTADATSGTNEVAPAYDGHTGPRAPTSAVAARAAAPMTPAITP